MFRELLQNSDDASSKVVEIRFETKRYIDRNDSNEDQASPLPNLKTALVCGSRFPPCSVDLMGSSQVHRWTFKNNGIPFRDEDWNRLKKIGTCGPAQGCYTADVSIQPKGTQPNRTLARSVLGSTACSPSLRSPSSYLEGGGWGFTGRMGKIRYEQLCHPCPASQWSHPPSCSFAVAISPTRPTTNGLRSRWTHGNLPRFLLRSNLPDSSHPRSRS